MNSPHGLGLDGSHAKRNTWEKRKDEQCVYFTCVHTYVSTYLYANTQTPCAVYACVYIFIFIHICMYRVHRALPNKYTPDVLILSSPRKRLLWRRKRNRAFEDIGHPTRCTDIWRAYSMFCVCLFWVRGDSGQHNNCFIILERYHVEEGFNHSIWFQRVEMRPRRSRFLF